MINWKVRVKNERFWVALIPAFILFIQAIADVFGISIDLSDIGEKILRVVDAVFIIMTIIGVVADPTTEGIGDSKLAMTYNEPKKRGE